MNVDKLKIILIFEKNLYSFSYNNDPETVFHKLFRRWTNPKKLSEIAASENMSKEDAEKFRKNILTDVKNLTKLIRKCVEHNTLNEFFEPFHKNPIKNEKFQESKGKFQSSVTAKTSKLRVYALRVNSEEFIITGGSIKFSRATQGETYTQKQVDDMKLLQAFLKDRGYSPDDIIYHLNCDL